ncbi:MAG: pyridoxamine 5'-phosphate oxidase [Actinobacteria bacterium]|nr:pyridoxamine 5'-phosphate oxidase [Actinomycetota bacterium]
MDLAGMRTQYEGAAPLDPEDLAGDPVSQLRRWLEEAVRGGLPSPNAMLLASVDAQGQPHSRYVLLRGLDPRGLSFYTNYASAKGRQLDAHPAAALTFGWLSTHRQVRVTGRVRRLAAAESDAYFASRPRATQLGTWASAQSEVIESRDVLLAKVAEAERRFAGREVERPPDWGGYLLEPEAVEFWQGQPDRLHDRLRYRMAPAGGWILERLSP